jgi:hypothetical protein
MSSAQGMKFSRLPLVETFRTCFSRGAREKFIPFASFNLGRLRLVGDGEDLSEVLVRSKGGKTVGERPVVMRVALTLPVRMRMIAPCHFHLIGRGR